MFRKLHIRESRKQLKNTYKKRQPRGCLFLRLFIFFRIVSVEHRKDDGFAAFFRSSFFNSLYFLKEEPMSEKASQCAEKRISYCEPPVRFKEKEHKRKKNRTGKDSVKWHESVFHGNNSAGYGAKHRECAPFKNYKAEKFSGDFIEQK